MRIFLIGMPGSGKTTLGKQLAVALNMSFVDLDLEIEKDEKKSIPEIFSSHGEDYFRNVESSHLRQWAGSDNNFVMATGGGAPFFHDGMKIINKAGKSIFLDVPFPELLYRSSKSNNRPLLKGDAEQKLKSLYEKRLSVYRQASIIISGENITLKSLLDKLKEG